MTVSSSIFVFTKSVSLVRISSIARRAASVDALSIALPPLSIELRAAAVVVNVFLLDDTEQLVVFALMLGGLAH
jgi:hypothetical protein